MVQCRTVALTRDCIAVWRATLWGPWSPALLAFSSLVSVHCDGRHDRGGVCELQLCVVVVPAETNMGR
jgi:hypothetical protein